MRTINWVCITSWNLVGADGTIIPNKVVGDIELQGTITLAPDKAYYFDCTNLNLGGPINGTGGVAAVRYYQEEGKDWVQAMVDARGSWHVDGRPGNDFSSADGSKGGITLNANFI
jgi:hypothetical protein